MEINAVSAAPERPCSPGGTAAGASASGAFLALLMQLMGIAGEGPVTPDPCGGNPVWNPEGAGTPGTPGGVFQTVPAGTSPLLPPADAGSMEPLLPPTGSLEGAAEHEEGRGGEQFTGKQEALLAFLLNFCGMMENNLPAAVPDADPGGGDGNSPAATPLSRLLETAGYLPVPLPEAAPGDGQAGQHMDAAVVELKGPALPDLLLDEAQSDDAFLKERILQLLRGPGVLEPGPGSRAVDSQLPEVRQPGVLHDVSPKGNPGETDSPVNGSGPVLKDVRVPVEAASGSAKPVEAREQVGSPEKRGGGETPQAGTNFSAINRHGGTGTPDHSPALHQPAGSGGGGTAATFHNPAGTVVQQETISPLKMPVLIGRVLRQAVARHIEGQTHLWFKLEPENLGEVVVRLVYRQGDVSAHFLASNAAAGDAIESALPQLREALAAQNLHLQSASVSVGHEGGLPPRSDYQQPGYNYGRQHSGPGGEPGGSTWQEQPADPLPGGINFFV